MTRRTFAAALLLAGCAPSAPATPDGDAPPAAPPQESAAAPDTLPTYRGGVRTVGERKALEAFLFAQPDGAPFRLDLRLHDAATDVAADEDGDLIVDLGYPFQEEPPLDPAERRRASHAVPAASTAGIELVVVPGGDRGAMHIDRGPGPGALRGTFVVDGTSGPRQGIVSFAVRPTAAGARREGG